MMEVFEEIIKHKTKVKINKEKEYSYESGSANVSKLTDRGFTSAVSTHR